MDREMAGKIARGIMIDQAIILICTMLRDFWVLVNLLRYGFILLWRFQVGMLVRCAAPKDSAKRSVDGANRRPLIPAPAAPAAIARN